MIVLSTLVNAFEPALRERYGNRLLPGHDKALRAMATCRTEQSPVMATQCNDCDHHQTYPHSCGHRLCPHCQHHEGQQWLERQRNKLLPVEYYLITFTVPRELRALIWQHQRIGYDLLLKLGRQTLQTFGLNDSTLSGKMRAHGVLHTHSRRLDFHPHVHFIVPAGAIDEKQRQWRKKAGKYLFPHQNLAKVFRAKWFDAMKQQGLTVRATLPSDWVVDCKHVGAGDKALTYLGKYLYRGVVREHDILRCENGQVTFRYVENSGTVKTRILAGADFLWLLLRHVLPKGFRRARDFGFLHSNCKRLIHLLHYLFGHSPKASVPATPRPAFKCQVCGGVMRIIATRIMPEPTRRLRPG